MAHRHTLSIDQEHEFLSCPENEGLPMIAISRIGCPETQTEFVHQRFLTMLPQIHRQASHAFRNVGDEVREELTQEVIARAYRTWVRLVHQGKESVTYPTPLAQFAIRQVCDGRRVAGRRNANDVLSGNACRIQGLSIERLDQRDAQSGAWNQLLVEDRKAGPAETAAARLDVAAWLGTLSKRHRRIAQALAFGESTAAVARKFGLSPGRVSQLRAWFRAYWERFLSDTRPDECAA